MKIFFYDRQRRMRSEDTANIKSLLKAGIVQLSNKLLNALKLVKIFFKI